MTARTQQVSVTAAKLPEWITHPEITGWDIGLAIVVVLASWALSRMASKAARRLASRLDSTSDNQRALAARMAKYFVLVLGVGIAISILGAPIQPVLAAAIIVAVVIVLALRGVADNFAAGVVLQSRKPIQVGDFVASQNYAGVVLELNGRSVVLDLLDGSQVHLPNSELLANPLVNKSVTGAVRCDVRVRAEWNGDLDEFRQLLTDAARAVSDVVADPSPQVFFEAVEPNRIRVLLGVWHQPCDRPAVASATVATIADALRTKATKAAIESTAPPPPSAPASTI